MAHALDDAFAKLTVGRRSSGRLMLAFGVVVLLVGAAGVYAVMAAMVAERRRELGIRLALGATRSQVVREILGHAGRYVAAGLARRHGRRLTGSSSLRALAGGL
jgi:hypothetical protein